MNVHLLNTKLKRVLVLIVVIVALVSTLLISAIFAQDNISNSNIKVSLSPDRTKSISLDGANLNSIAYVYVDVQNVKRVIFYIDGTNTINRNSVERYAPYDFAKTTSDGKSNPYDFSKLSSGTHVIYAKIVFSPKQRIWISATFSVGIQGTNSTTTSSSTTSTTVQTTTTVPVVDPPINTLNNKVIYSSSQGLQNAELYSSNIDGTGKFRLTNDINYSNAWPRVTPDGKTVYFYRYPPSSLSSDYFNYSLWKVNIDGTGLKELIPKGANGWWLQGHVGISPDGTKLVFAALVTLKGMTIFTSDLEGKNIKEVPLKSQAVIDPDFTPDGKIIFTACPPGTDANDGSNYEVYLTDVDGSFETRLTYDKYRDHDPAVSPDGKRISFLTLVEPGYKVVGKWAQRIMNIDGTNLHYLISEDNFSANPRWVDNSTTVYGYFDWDLAGWGIRITNVDTLNSQILLQPEKAVGLSTATVIDPFAYKG